MQVQTGLLLSNSLDTLRDMTSESFIGHAFSRMLHAILQHGSLLDEPQWPSRCLLA